jgi:hypothetical protein
VSFSKQEQEKLKSILRQTYRDKESLEVGGLRPEDFRDRLTEIGTIQPIPEFLAVFAQFVWRLAPVISLLILAFTGVLLALDLTSGYDVFQVLMNGREEPTLSQMLGI